MNLRLLAATLLMSPLFTSCAVLQWPAQIISSVVSPLRGDAGEAMPAWDYMETDAMMALKHSKEAAPLPARRSGE